MEDQPKQRARPLARTVDSDEPLRLAGRPSFFPPCPPVGWLLLLLWLAPALLADPWSPVERLDQSWRLVSLLTDAGLEGKNIFNIAFERGPDPERAGTVWLATSDGLREYDGYDWRRHGKTTGLPSDFVRCVLVTRAGQIWVGTDQGAGIYEPGKFRTHGSETGLAGPNVRRIMEDADGSIWFCSDSWPQAKARGGLAVLRDGKWTAYHLSDGLPGEYVVNYFQDSAGTRFAATLDGLAELQGDRWQAVPLPALGQRSTWGSISLAESPAMGLMVSNGRRVLQRQQGQWQAPSTTDIHEHGICATSDGKILATGLVAPGRKAFVEWTGRGWEKVSAEFRAPHNYTEDLREAPDGSVWVVGFDCLARWQRQGGEWQEYPGLPLPRLVDGEGRVWFAWFTREQPSSRPIRVVGQQWEKLDEVYENLVAGRAGSVWSWTSNHLTHWIGDRMEQIPLKDTGLSTVTGIHPDGRQQTWVVGRDARGGNAIAAFDGQKWRSRSVPGLQGTPRLGQGDPTAEALWLVVDQAASPDLTLARVDLQGLDQFAAPGNVLSLYRSGLRMDRTGALWVFGDSGLFRWQRGRPQVWETVTNVPGRLVFGCQERDDGLWFACNSSTGGRSGLARLQDGSWTALPAETLFNFSKTGDGTLLLGGVGKFTLTPNLPDARPVQVEIPTDDLIDAVAKGGDGAYWCGSARAVFRFQPDGVPPRSKLVTAETNILSGGSLRVIATASERFQPRGQRNNCRFAWRVDEGPWSEFAREGTRDFPTRDLSTGPHTLEVRAQDAGFSTEPTPARLAFQVFPLPLQSRPWFVPLLGAALLVLTALTFLAIRARVQIAGHARELEAVVADRTAQLQVDLQDRKGLADALERQRAELQLIFDTVPAIIFFKDREHRHLRVNAAHAAFHGRPREEIEGRTQKEMGLAHAEAYYRDDDAVIATGQARRGIIEPVETKRGTRWLQTDKFPMRDPSGQINGVVGFAVDITERRQAELERRRSEERLQLALKASRMGVWEWDLQTNRLFWSKEWREFIGLEETGATMDQFKKLLHPDDASRVLAATNRAITERGIYEAEFRLLRPDGREVWLANLGQVETDAQGQPARMIGTVVDITARKQADTALRETQERFAQLAENLSEVFWLTDTTKNEMLYISPGYEKIWGQTCASLYASPKNWLAAIHPEDRDRVLHAAITKQALGDYNEEYRITRPDGAIRWIHDRAFPIRDPEGRVYRVAGLAEDVTGRRQLEEQLRQSQKMEAIGQLAGGVAHDFNNLLTIILGNASLLLSPGLPPGEGADCAREVVQAAERAAGLTRQLLLFSRKQVMRPARLDLNDTVSNMTKMLQRILGEDITLQAQYANRLPAIQADAGMIEQVLLNLAVNARDAMPRGGRLTITTSLEAIDQRDATRHAEATPGLYVGLVVSDTGTGIAREDLPRIFEPFFTTKEIGKGTGLGLATVYGIVKQHRGWITAGSTLGQGATFRMGFPAVPGDPEERPETESLRELPRGSETILVVEDEPALRFLVVTLLQRCGYTVVAAASGVEALALWPKERQSIGLVLTDLIMPQGVNGQELADHLKADRPDLKIIYTSGYSADLSAKGLALVEGVNFLQKPYPPQKMVRLVRECLDRA